MSREQVQRYEDEDEQEPPVQHTAVSAVDEKSRNDDLDRVLHDIEEIIDFENADAFVRSYVQKGGQ